MSLALSLADRLYEAAQKVDRAWKPYADAASHMDGHSLGCPYRNGFVPARPCSCGYAAVEAAIKELRQLVTAPDAAQES